MTQGPPHIETVEGALVRGLETRGRCERRKPVLSGDHLVKALSCGKLARPADQGRHPNPPFERAALRSAEGDIACAEVAPSPVVARPDQDRVARDPFGIELRHDPPDPVIEGGDHSGVSPAVGISDVNVAIQVRFGGLQRRVRGVEGDIQEHRSRLVAILDQAHCLVGDQICRVALFAQHRAVAMPVQSSDPYMGEVVHRRAEVTIGLVESAPVGMRRDPVDSEMPLPRQESLVASRPQGLRQQVLVQRKRSSRPDRCVDPQTQR